LGSSVQLYVFVSNSSHSPRIRAHIRERYWSAKKDDISLSLTFVDEGVEVAPEDEQPNEEEVEEDAEGEYDPGEDLPGPPGPCLVVGLLRGSFPGLLPVQNLNHAFFRSLQGHNSFPDSVQPVFCSRAKMVTTR
jgi:hypothetical protein